VRSSGGVVVEVTVLVVVLLEEVVLVVVEGGLVDDVDVLVVDVVLLDVVLVDVVVSVVVVIVPLAYSTCSSGAALGSPSRDFATRLPLPVTMSARALPLVQPGRATISCTTASRSGVR
jgi:hypothetical protein